MQHLGSKINLASSSLTKQGSKLHPPLIVDSDDAITEVARNPLSPCVLAMAAYILKKESFDTQRIMKILMKDKATTYTLQRIGRMLNDEQLTLWINNEDKLTLGHMKSIVKLSQSEYKEMMLKVIREGWSCRRLESEVFEKARPIVQDSSLKTFIEEVSGMAGRDVQIQNKPGGNGGYICFRFYDNIDLENFLTQHNLQRTENNDF